MKLRGTLPRGIGSGLVRLHSGAPVGQAIRKRMRDPAGPDAPTVASPSGTRGIGGRDIKGRSE